MHTSRKSILIGLLLLVSVTFTQAQVGVGANNPNPSAQLEISSTSKGLLPPRMTITQRNAIISPATGLIIFNTTNNALNIYFSGAWYQLSNSVVPGSIATLVTASPTNNGTLKSGTAASGVSSIVSYTGGNGENHSGQTVSSTGVTGLTATLPAGIFALGEGTLTYNITGTPASEGTASFALNVGGQNGTLTVISNFNCGTSTVTFTYNGSSVTYGTVVGANNTCWLDRNLGARQVATSSNDTASYGDLFQWGRAADGHQIRTSSRILIRSNTDVPGHGQFIGTSNTRDWRSPPNNNLWQGVNGINNPCPVGFRLPTRSELEAERLTWVTNNGAGAYASPLKLPLTGYRHRDSGVLTSFGVVGYYWSSTVDTTFPTNSYDLNFSSAAGTGGQVRGSGIAVRCIKN